MADFVFTLAPPPPISFSITEQIAPSMQVVLTTFMRGSLNTPLPIESKAIDFTVRATDANTVFLITTADKTVTLPSSAIAGAGLAYTFIVTAAALSTGSGFSISPNAVDKLMGAGITSADNKDFINDGVTDAEGDFMTIISDGVDGWYIQSFRGVWTREA